MKNPKFIVIAPLLIVLVAVASVFVGKPSFFLDLKDVPSEFSDVHIRELKEKAGQAAGVEGTSAGRFRYDLKTGVCKDESGKEGLNERSLAEVLASKDGECVRFPRMISKPGGIHREGQFDRLNLRGADLRSSVLNYVVLNDLDLRGAKMSTFQFGYGRFWGRIDKFSELPQGEGSAFCRLEGNLIHCHIKSEELGKVGFQSRRDCVLSAEGTKHPALQGYLGRKITDKSGGFLTAARLVSNEPFYIEGADSPGQFIRYYSDVEGPEPKGSYHYVVPGAANYYLSGKTDLHVIPLDGDGKTILFRIFPENGGNAATGSNGVQVEGDFAIEFRCEELK